MRECNKGFFPNKWVTVTLVREEGYFLDEENFDGTPPQGFLVSGSLKH
jgi:hypothetical protein